MKVKADVRLAVSQDVPRIGVVARRTWNDTYDGIILRETQERLLERWYAPAALEEAIGRSQSWFYVAVVQGEVIGFAQFLMIENGRGELRQIYVLPEWQRLGIGNRLLKEGLSTLSRHGAKEVFVLVSKDNTKGISFYERKGFHRIREFSVELLEASYERLEYALSLEPS